MIILELLAPFVARTNGVDGPSQLNLESQFNGLLAQGIWFPRWSLEGFHGFGSPAFYFYPPLAFYATGVLRLLSGVSDPKVLFQAVGLLATIASFFSARGLLLAIGSARTQAALGALLYAFGPFRIAELYSRSSLSSHVAYIFLPLVWWGLVHLFRDRELGSRALSGVLLFSVAFALLVLTSIPLASVTIVTMLVAAVIFRRELQVGAIGRFGLAAALATSLVAFYIIPVVIYQPFVKLEYLSNLREFFAEDLVHLRNFAGLYHLVLLYGGIAAILFAYWHLRRHNAMTSEQERKISQLTLAVLVLILLLEIPPIGRPLLTKIPLLQLVQGTWRFYIDVLLLGACAVGVANNQNMRKAARQVIWIWGAGALLPATLIVLNLHLGTHQIGPTVDPPEYMPIYFHSEDRLLARDSGIFESSGISRMSSPSSNGRPTLALVREEPDRKQYAVSLPSNASVIFPRFYWPAWHLYVNDTETKTWPDSALGRATANLPAGRYQITWKLERSLMEQAGLWISGITAVGIIILTAGARIRRYGMEKGTRL